MDAAAYDALFRYFHILFGIAWIGLLYFFNFVNAPLLKIKLRQPYDVDMVERATGPGLLLGIAMLFNVWFIIWPNQKVILRNNKKIAGGVGDDEKKALQAE